MGCCISRSDDAVFDDEWRVTLGDGRVFERWIVPEKVLVARDVKGNLSIAKRHQNRLTAIRELQMLSKCSAFGNPTMVGNSIFYDYIPGIDLFEATARLPEERRKSFSGQRDALICCLRVAEAIHHLHKTGVTHLDVKAENILLRNFSMRAPVLIDFEFSVYHRGWTLNPKHVVRTDRAKGTIGYLAPEIFAQSLAGPPSDVWSFGSLLYFAMHGKLPFSDEIYVAMLKKMAVNPLLFRFTMREKWNETPLVGPAARWDLNAFTMPFAHDPRERVTMGYMIRMLKRAAAFRER